MNSSTIMLHDKTTGKVHTMQSLLQKTCVLNTA